jgi:TolB-like protein/tetratricopeptide (TPR) repeat protein
LRYHFEDFVLDTDRRELHRGTKTVSIAPQVFDLLEYLIRNREHVVGKEDLINAVWNGRAVSDAALTTRLNVARSVVGDSGEEQRLIKTLQRKGFRFVGSVREVQEQGCTALSDDRVGPLKSVPALPDKPSIAVLPFQNISGDPDQDYFADGMVDEITTALSRFKFLFVIARNSSFAYKGIAVDIKQVGRELGVRYVLEGSVRKAAGKVRIIGQLIDAATGIHLWADRFEGELIDIFALQDRMTESVVSAVAPKMFQIEIGLAARRPNDLSAYDLCLRAVPHLNSRTPEGTAKALRLATRALEIDPGYGFAATLAGTCHFVNVGQAWAADPKSQTAEIAEGFRLLRLANRIDENDCEALSALSRATAMWTNDFDTAKELADRAVSLNPNAADAWVHRGWSYLLAGQPEEAIKSFERAIRISPFDRLLASNLVGIGFAFIDLGRFDEAVAVARKALQRDQAYGAAYRCLAAALAYLGRDAEARKTVTQSLQIEPDFRISKLMARGARSQILFEGLRKAGFPQ